MSVTIVDQVQCSSNSAWTKEYTSSSNLGSYQVSWDYMPQGDYQYGLTCNCKGYEFRKTCKHVIDAEEHHCGWSQQFGIPYNGDGKCPECGAAVEGVRVAI